MKKKLILFISLFLLLFASVPSVYADSTKSFWTGGYWLGCFDVYMEIDFYVYRIANENFTIKLSNLDKGEFSMWKIENHKLYLWIPPNVNKFEYVCDLPVETWVRLKLSYHWDYYLDFSLVYAENDVPIYTITDFIVDNNADTWDVPKSSGSPCFGISPEGNMEFRLIISEPYFALSKIHIHSGMKYFTFVTTTHLDEEFNDDNFEDWDTFDLNGFNYTITEFTKDSCLVIYGATPPTDPTEKQEREWWEKLRDKIWHDLVTTWNYLTSTIASLLPKQLVDFFNWLWGALNWLWDMITLAFAMVLQFAPYFGLIILLGFLGASIDAFIEGSLDSLRNFIMFWYNITVSIISGIATVIQTIYDFIKIW